MQHKSTGGYNDWAIVTEVWGQSPDSDGPGTTGAYLPLAMESTGLYSGFPKSRRLPQGVLEAQLKQGNSKNKQTSKTMQTETTK